MIPFPSTTSVTSPASLASLADMDPPSRSSSLALGLSSRATDAKASGIWPRREKEQERRAESTA